MVNRPSVSVENNFIGGLKTEYTALNFPENACVAASNTVFSIIGEADRRGGFNFEANFQANSIPISGVANNTYKWNNVGGDGQTQIIVQQNGTTLYFYLSSAATITSPLSKQILVSTVNISNFVASGGSFDATIECEFADGNGYLFIFHPSCDPVYCTYNSASKVITPTVITVRIRDFLGIPDGLQQGTSVSTRPTTLSNEHHYNLVNQGWAPDITGLSATNTINLSTTAIGSSVTFAIAPSMTTPFPVGSSVSAFVSPVATNPISTVGLIGTVTASSVSSVTMTVSYAAGTATPTNWVLVYAPGNLLQWFSVLANYPSNADQWWTYKDTNVTSPTTSAYNALTGAGLLGQFNPRLASQGYVTASTTQAPQGSIVFPAFIQNRSTVTAVPNITTVSTTARPSNGCFYAGRVFYTGVNANFQAAGDAPFYTWTETIYFSQIITTQTDFGLCYQQNDPTSETLYDLLPSDGGTINVQGSGAIYKLFPVQNGLLVFAANGIWFITGSQGIGFSATDYTVTKISGIQSISRHTYVNVLGWPVFWNEEGIYQVQPSQQGGGLQVNNLCLGTILSLYNTIPLQSKKYARGDYNPISFVIQWMFRSTNETGISDRYQFDTALNLNTYKAPFYPYSFTVAPATTPYVCGINYVAGLGGSTSPEPTFKYLTSFGGSSCTFSEENDFTNWKDWVSYNTTDYISTFTTGYKLHGQAQRQFGIEYVYVFSSNAENTAYSLQSLWDFSTSGNSGKWSGSQVVNNNIPNFGNVFRRLRLRGHGLAVQLKFTSVSGMPFSFAGWSILENQSGSV